MSEAQLAREWAAGLDADARRCIHSALLNAAERSNGSSTSGAERSAVDAGGSSDMLPLPPLPGERRARCQKDCPNTG